jgi:methionyl-tRNA formyltransferase
MSIALRPVATKTTLLCLATRKGYEVLRAATRIEHGRRLAVSTFRETNVVESYDEKIRGLAEEAGVAVVPWKELRSNPVGFLAGRGIDSVLCIGWRYLVPDEAIRFLGGEVVIAHDSLLPKYRGFAPLVTAMIAGESETGVTFLRAGRSVDDGDVLWQGRAPIGAGDTISDMIDKLVPLYVEGACRYLRGELAEGRPQDERAATYSIWRDAEDYRIDWTEDADRIERTIRALGPPYPGAQATLDGRAVVVRRAEVVADLPFAIRQPGKVWSLDAQGRPTVVCGSGLLKVLDATADGESILPLKALRLRFS